MAFRSCVLIALAVGVFVVSCAAEYTEANSSSEAKSSSDTDGSYASTKSISSSKTRSRPADNCVKVKRCPRNEEFSYCIETIGRPQFCSQSGQSLRCPQDPPPSCTEGCVCKEDYLRNVNGTCIPARKCNTNCASTEVLDSCPVDCAADYCPTSNAETEACLRPDQDQCPPPVCKCRFNYRRASNGSCIPTRDCPPFDCSALPNEEYNSCPPLCPTDDCSQASPTGECPQRFGRIGIVLNCNPKCRCIKGYWRKNGICVPYKDCPQSCPLNEEYVSCIQGVCRAMNCSQKGQDVPCPDRAWPEEQCDAGCICKEYYLRAANGSCVPEDQCDTNVCPANEEYSTCTQALCRAQNCSQRGKPIACPSIVEGGCLKGCVCKSGFLRHENGTCIAEDQCECGANEVLDTCPSFCSSDYCPYSEDANEKCETPDPCPEPTCKCAFNYRRSEQTGQCIPTEECPPFDCSGRPNEVYTPCPPLCPSDECGMPRVTGRCPFRIGIRLECNPKCQCKDGYGRSNGTCVPFAECPGLCPENEEYNPCTQAVCRNQNCTNRNGPVACPRVIAGFCKKGCVCKKNYFRNSEGACVPAKQCEPCGENEVLDSCPSDCPSDYCPTCEEDNKKCPIPDPCPKPKCKCAFNYRRDENGKCIPTEDCPPFDCSDRPNEVYTPCPPLCPSDACSMARVTGRCPFKIGIRLECNPRCQCQDGYGRSDGTCVPFEECPDLCPVNEEYSSCTQAVCRPQNCDNRDGPVACPSIAQGSCIKGCVCKQYYYRNENGTCVTDEDCDGASAPLCPYQNEKFAMSNIPNCPYGDLCKSMVIRIPACTEPEVPGCVCVSGYYRINKTSPCIPMCECPEMSGTLDCQ